MARPLQFESLPARLALSVTIAETEPNNTEVTGDAIHVAQDGQALLTGVSSSKDDKDYFSISPTTSGPLSVSVHSLNGNVPQLEITDRANNQLLQTEPNDGSNSGQTSLQAGVQYLIRMRSKNNDAAQYEVTLHFGGQTSGGEGGGTTSPIPVLATTEQESNDARSSANLAAFGPDRMVRLTGTAANTRDEDYFRFTAPENGELSIAVHSTGDQLAKLSIEDALGNKVAETEPNDGLYAVTAQVTAGVIYFVRMRSADNGPAPYAVDLALNGGILIGDSDGSGQFDTADLIFVMQAGKYRTEQSASFAEGDWNADGLFDEQDLMIAFQAGRFVG